MVVAVGWLQPFAFEWGVLPAIAGLILGVILIIASRPRLRTVPRARLT
jgi:hypothetical protein